jgi:hypothetical protein
MLRPHDTCAGLREQPELRGCERTAGICAPRSRHLLSTVAQQRCHIASEKMVDDASEMGSTAIEA